MIEALKLARELIEWADAGPGFTPGDVIPEMQAIRDNTVKVCRAFVALSETARSEGYPGIAHDLETMRTALRSIAIVDDADCAHASDPEAMKKIARDALRGVK